MKRQHLYRVVLLGLVSLLILVPGVQAQDVFAKLDGCEDVAFTVEEDFIPRNMGVIPDGVEYVSDGDLLGMRQICARNQALLEPFGLGELGDLGLDAVDILDYERGIVAFSTELDAPEQILTGGDLLITTGAIIPNQIFVAFMDVPYNIGLDAVHFIGEPDRLIEFAMEAAQFPRQDWSIDLMRELLEHFDLDILYSIEGTAGRFPDLVLDGDVLSLRNMAVIFTHDTLFSPSIPAGIPNRGVDFGVDALSGPRRPSTRSLLYSTEIGYQARPPMSDGDVLSLGQGVVITNSHLLANYEPQTDMGLDGLWMLDY